MADIVAEDCTHSQTISETTAGIWGDTAGDAAFIFSWSASQATYGVRSERAKIPAISNIDDAQLWANAYLADKIAPIKSASLRMTTKTRFFDYEPCVNAASIPLLAIRKSSDTPATRDQYLINRINYTLTENGLDIELELGMRQAKISDYLGWIEWQIDQLRQGVAGGGEASYGVSTTSGETPGTVIPEPGDCPSKANGVTVVDNPMMMDPITGEVWASVTICWDDPPAEDAAIMSEILVTDLGPTP